LDGLGFVHHCLISLSGRRTKINYLQLCQRVFQEGGISGQLTSTQNQTGEAARVVGWVATAYQEILNDQGMVWNFQHKSHAVQLTPNVGTYSFADLALPTGVQWDTRSMRVAINANFSDETFLQHMRFDQFRDYWLFSSRRDTKSRPLNVAVDTETNLRIAPLPDAPYWLILQYQDNPATLIEEGDTPIFPARFHMVIVWRALRHYGMYEAAPEVVSRADMALKETMLQLQMDQGLEVVVGDPIC